MFRNRTENLINVLTSDLCKIGIMHIGTRSISGSKGVNLGRFDDANLRGQIISQKNYNISTSKGVQNPKRTLINNNCISRNRNQISQLFTETVVIFWMNQPQMKCW